MNEEGEFQGIDVDMVGLNSAPEVGGPDQSPGKRSVNHYNSAEGRTTEAANNHEGYFSQYQS